MNDMNNEPEVVEVNSKLWNREENSPMYKDGKYNLSGFICHHFEMDNEILCEYDSIRQVPLGFLAGFITENLIREMINNPELEDKIIDTNCSTENLDAVNEIVYFGGIKFVVVSGD